jgi:thioredoxin 1
MADSKPDDRKGGGDQPETATAVSGPDEPVPVEGPDHLEDIVGQRSIVLVDFHAEWCGPCKLLEPTIEKIADETPATVAKVDIDACQEIAAEHSIRSVPTLLLFANGQIQDRVIGVSDEDRLEKLVDQHI